MKRREMSDAVGAHVTDDRRAGAYPPCKVAGHEAADVDMLPPPASRAPAKPKLHALRWFNLLATGRPRSSAGAIPLLCAAMVPGAGVLPAPAAPLVPDEPSSLNLAESFSALKDKLQTEGSVSVITCIGDSLTFRGDTFLPYFRSLMQAHYGNAGAGYQGMSNWTGAGFNFGWVYGYINQDSTPHRSLDGLWGRFEGSPLTPTGSFFTAMSDIAILHYVAEPSGGNVRLRTPDLQDRYLNFQAPSPEFRTLQYSLMPQNRTAWFYPFNNGTLTILGQESRTGTSGVVINRVANGGWGVNNYLQRDWTFDAQLRQLDSDLIFIWLGQNDQGYDRATYAVPIGSLVDRVKAASPGARIVLVGTYDQGSPRLPALAYAMGDVAAARGLGFINLFDAAGPRAYFDWYGLLADQVHFNAAGGEYIGNLFYQAFQTDGASLRIAKSDINRDGVVDLGDLLVFFHAYDADHGLADLDRSGAVDLGDFLAFFNDYDQQ